MKPIFNNRQIYFQILILVVSNIIVTGITLFILYSQSVSNYQKNLVDIINRQQMLVKVLHEQGQSDVQIIKTFKRIYLIGKTGEFAVAYRKNDSIKYLLAKGENPNFKLSTNNNLGIPMRHALAGESGFIKGLDYKGQWVFAAYTYCPELNWGLVAKIPISEVYQPYIWVAVLTLLISSILVVIWVYVFKKVSSPLLQKIIDSEETYRMLFSSVNDAIFVSALSPEGQPGPFIEVNDIACKRLGYTRDELLTKKPYDIHSEKTRQVDAIIFKELINSQQSIIELEQVAKNGTIVPTEISSRITTYNNKTYIHSVARDISERKRMEEQLQQNLTLMQNTQKLAKIGGWEWNLETNNMYWTEEMYRIHDFETGEIEPSAEKHIARSQQCYSDSDRELVMVLFNRCIETGEAYDLEVPFTTIKGRQLWIRTAAQAKWENGKIIKIIGNISDITDRKQSELMLKEKSEEIEAQNEEYKQINSELLAAKAKAEENDRLKTAFLQNMSHEIRTPMNAIMGFSDLLADNFRNKKKLEQFAKIINQRSNDLLDLINEILDVAKIESGQLSVHFEEFRLNDLFIELHQIFKEHQKRLDKPDIKFTIDNLLHPDLTIATDKGKLKQIFINLIGNAFKFTDSGQIVAGCMLNTDNKLEFYVSDTGIGIPADKHQFIFERFAQVNYQNNRLYGGTGLGLSIVKGLVSLLDGSIRLESEVGKGTSFYFTLSYHSSNSALQEHSATNLTGTYNFKGRTILVVEDDSYNAQYLTEILENAGFTIFHTIFGQEAIEISNSNEVDIVLMDISLPDINGYQASKQILKHKPTLKIIAQTAYAAPADKQNALETGCVDYLSKPLKRNDLLALLHKHLNQEELIQC